MTEQPHIEDSDSADEGLTRIVSYLDGELDDTQMNEVEHDLINDPEMRSHADILSRTWALLDELDQVSASQQFTQETLATVASETVSDPSPTSSGRLRRIAETLARHKIVPCFLIGVIGGVAGLCISNHLSQKREATGASATTIIVLDNYELVRNADVYSVVPDVSALQQLRLPDAQPTDSAIPASKEERNE